MSWVMDEGECRRSCLQYVAKWMCANQIISHVGKILTFFHHYFRVRILSPCSWSSGITGSCYEARSALNLL